MSENATETTNWAPLEDAVAQMKELDEKARKAVRETAEEVRTRSEKAIDEARVQTEKTLRLVRKNLDDARESFEERTGSWSDFDMPEFVEKSLENFQKEFLATVERVAKALNISTDDELTRLRKKVDKLEKKVNDLARNQAA